MDVPAAKGLSVYLGQGWIQVQVRVQPRSSCNRLAGVLNGALRVHLTAPPVEGKANEALRTFLADLFRIPKRDVEIISGSTSRVKRVRLYGLTKEELENCLPEGWHKEVGG